MSTVEYFLDAQELSVLRRLIGLPLQTIFSPAVGVDKRGVHASHLSMAVEKGKQWLNLRCDWDDTPKHHVDYFHIEVVVGQEPEKIAVKRDEPGIGGLLFPVSSISTNNISPTKRIVVFSMEESFEDESVAYDAAIVFERNDGTRFALVVDNTIAGQLIFVTDEQAIGSAERKYTQRVTVV